MTIARDHRLTAPPALHSAHACPPIVDSIVLLQICGLHCCCDNGRLQRQRRQQRHRHRRRRTICASSKIPAQATKTPKRKSHSRAGRPRFQEATCPRGEVPHIGSCSAARPAEGETAFYFAFRSKQHLPIIYVAFRAPSGSVARSRSAAPSRADFQLSLKFCIEYVTPPPQVATGLPPLVHSAISLTCRRWTQ